MHAWRMGLGSLLLGLGACGHLDEGVRAKGSDSATARLPVLLARGEYAEAEALIAELVKAGTLSLVQAEAWRQRVQPLKEQRPGPGRLPPPVSPREPEDGLPRTCGSVFPQHPLCWALPEEYTFASVRLALESMRQRLGQKNLVLHGEAPTDRGPCPETGRHLNVRSEGMRMGSITCCRCCVDVADGAIEWEKCRIVW